MLLVCESNVQYRDSHTENQFCEWSTGIERDGKRVWFRESKRISPVIRVTRYSSLKMHTRQSKRERERENRASDKSDITHSLATTIDPTGTLGLILPQVPKLRRDMSEANRERERDICTEPDNGNVTVSDSHDFSNHHINHREAHPSGNDGDRHLHAITHK